MQDMLKRVNAGINALAKLELNHLRNFYEWYRLLKKRDFLQQSGEPLFNWSAD